MIDKIKISEKEFPTLLALTPEEQALGLMHRKDWPPPVMSFIYKRPSNNLFWMHKTPLPLDIVFCRDNKIISICKGIPNSTAIINCGEPSDLVVEFPFGTCKNNDITIGSNIELVLSKSSQMKVFFIKNGLY